MVQRKVILYAHKMFVIFSRHILREDVKLWYIQFIKEHINFVTGNINVNLNVLFNRENITCSSWSVLEKIVKSCLSLTF